MKVFVSKSVPGFIVFLCLSPKDCFFCQCSKLYLANDLVCMEGFLAANCVLRLDALVQSCYLEWPRCTLFKATFGKLSHKYIQAAKDRGWSMFHWLIIQKSDIRKQALAKIQLRSWNQQKCLDSPRQVSFYFKCVVGQ